VAAWARMRCKVPNRKTMKAAVVEKFGEPLVVREVPIPRPGPGQALVQVFAIAVVSHRSACGGRPLAGLAKDAAHSGPPRSGNRRSSRGGSYTLAGRRARRNRLAAQCLRTLRLLSRRTGNACAERQNSGYSVNGTFAQYALGPTDYLGRIPKNLSWVAAAPILCAGVTAYKGLQ
jgi:alcohol dehydrogenase, propanol-preferring